MLVSLSLCVSVMLMSAGVIVPIIRGRAALSIHTPLKLDQACALHTHLHFNLLLFYWYS